MLSGMVGYTCQHFTVVSAKPAVDELYRRALSHELNVSPKEIEAMEHQIKVYGVTPYEAKELDLHNMHVYDEACLLLASRLRSKLLAYDDFSNMHHIVRYAGKFRLKVIPSPHLIAVLVKQGHVKRIEAIRAFFKLAEMKDWFSGPFFEFSHKLLF
jgi:hypothetical protein